MVYRIAVELTGMAHSSHPSAQLPLSVPVFQILVSLADRDLHGYAVIQDVAQRTGGEVRLTASTLYAAIRRMLEAGMIDEVDQPRRAPAGEDDRRRYYRMTQYGREIAQLEAARLERAAAMARAKRLLPRIRKA
jgi:DNA-binding PadR family transcriptional regulator